MTIIQFLLPGILLIVKNSFSIRYERCELARELVQQHGFAKETITDWICLAQHESNLETGLVSPRSRDGSKAHGIFQISDLWWCSEPGEVTQRNACKRQCRSFRDSHLADDISCAKQIFAETEKLSGNGFSAWVAWNTNCNGRNLDSYVDGCFVDDDESYIDDYPQSVEFSPNFPTSSSKPTSLPRNPKQSPPSLVPNNPKPVNYPRYPTATSEDPTATSIYPTATSRYPTKEYPSGYPSYHPGRYPPSPRVKIFQCQGSTMECQKTSGPGQYTYRCKLSQAGLGKLIN